MQPTTRWIPRLFLLLLAGLVPVACAEPTQDAAAAEMAATEGLRLEVSHSERELYVFIDNELVATHPVAIGQPDHETPTGEFGIHQVDWNPDWRPPDSEWAEDREFKEPGDPDNPMGRARLRYKGAYSIHGTEALESLGEAASHGSIRVANDVAKELARLVMEYGGAERPESWYEAAINDPTEMREVPIPDPVPLILYD